MTEALTGFAPLAGPSEQVEASLEHELIGGTNERCKSLLVKIGEQTLDDIKRLMRDERANPALQKFHAALDEVYSHALETDNAQLRLFCLFIYLAERTRYAQVGLNAEH